MRKTTALFLIFALLFALMIPAAAEDVPVDEPTPIVYLRGNNERLFDADGNEVFADIGDRKYL